MTDLTLEDLAGVGDSGGSDGGSGGGGEWVESVINKLDEKGLLDKLAENYMENQMGGGGGGQPAASDPAAAPARSDGGDQDVDAEKVKGLMLQLYDNSSMIPGLSDDPSLSELIELLDEHEDMANELIRRHL